MFIPSTIINLLPAAEQQKRRVDALNYYTLMGGIIAVTGALVLAGLLLLFDQVYKLNLDNVRTDKARAEGQAALYLDTEKQAKELEIQLSNLRKAHNQTTHWATLLNELQSQTPPSVSIQNISIKQGSSGAQAQNQVQTKTEVTGSADSRRSLGEFQLALAGSPYFKNVNIDTSNLTGTGTVEYKISLEVNFDKLNGPAR